MEQMKQIAKISMDTVIPIGMLVLIIGGVMWLTSVANKVDYLQVDLSRQEKQTQLQFAEIKSDVKDIKSILTERLLP